MLAWGFSYSFLQYCNAGQSRSTTDQPGIIKVVIMKLISPFATSPLRGSTPQNPFVGSLDRPVKGPKFLANRLISHVVYTPLLSVNRA